MTNEVFNWCELHLKSFYIFVSGMGKKEISKHFYIPTGDNWLAVYWHTIFSATLCLIPKHEWKKLKNETFTCSLLRLRCRGEMINQNKSKQVASQLQRQLQQKHRFINQLKRARTSFFELRCRKNETRYRLCRSSRRLFTKLNGMQRTNPLTKPRRKHHC